jgi:hypothetical protein
VLPGKDIGQIFDPPVMATVMALIAFGGFSRTFYFRALLGVEGDSDLAPLPAVVVVHGIVFTVWVAVFLIQSWLIQGRRASVHSSRSCPA